MKQYRWVLLTFYCAAFLAVACAHAQTADDGQPSVLKEDKGQSDYVYDLKLLIKKSKDNIRNVNDKIKEQAVLKRNQQREQKAREYYEQAMKLRDEGRLEEARQLFDKAIKITEHPEMQYYIKESERRSKLQANALEHQESDQERRQAEDQKVPDYKSTRSYLKRIDSDIELLAKAQHSQEEIAAQKEELEKMRIARDKAEVVYNEAIAAYDAKDFPQAKVKFLETDSIFPNQKKTKYYLNRIDEDARLEEEAKAKAAREKEAEALYVQALNFYQGGQFEEAKKKFVAVEVVLPNYKQLLDYLDRIDDDILRKKEADLERIKEDQVKGLYNQAQVLYQGGQFAEAKEKFLQVEVIYPGYKETTRILGGIDAQVDAQKKDTEDRVKNEAAEKLYVQAMSLYQATDFIAAKEKLIQVDVMAPDYKDTVRYIARIDGDIERKKNDEALKAKLQEIDPVYIQALELYKEDNFVEARNKFTEVQVLMPGYKDTVLYLARIDKDVQAQEARIAREEKIRKVDSLYVSALQLFASRKFTEAKEKFLELAGVDPAYKNARDYLSRIDKDIREEAARQARAAAEEQAAEPYAQAVTLYHDGDFESAKAKFLKVVKLVPDYKKTRFYLSHVDEDAHAKNRELELERLAKAENLYREAIALEASGKIPEAYKKLTDLEAFYPNYKAVQTCFARLRKAGIEKGIVLPDVPKGSGVAPVAPEEAKIIALYKQAVELYKDQKYDEAQPLFEAVTQIKVGYRSTRKYLDSIQEIKASLAQKAEQEKARQALLPATPARVEGAKKAVPAVAAESIEPAVSVPIVRSPAEESRAIAALATRSSGIYQQIRSLSQDKELLSAASTFAKVDHLIENLETENRRLADNMARQKKADEEEAARAKRQEQEQSRQQVKLTEVEKNAQKEKAAAKAREEASAQKTAIIQEGEDKRSMQRAELERLKNEQREAQLKAEVLYRQALSALGSKNYYVARERLTALGKSVPDYKDTTRLLARLDRLQDEEKLNAEEASDRASIKKLADEATALNLSILELSKKKNYSAVEVKFNDLESILKEIKISKNRMVTRREQFESHWKEIAVQREGVARKNMAPKGLKQGEDFIPARQKGKTLIQAGQQLYAAENFAEARVKFVEAAQVDPANKTSLSYIKRIDRILSRHDYEARQMRDKAKARDLERKQEALPGAPVAAAQPSMDIKRAVEVAEEGEALYKAKRYREARIKYEELLQVGTEKDKRKASKSLDLIDRALEKEQQAAEADRQAQEEKLLEERRTQAKLMSAKDHRAQEREMHKTQELVAVQRELDIRRQQELREIERKNARQRQEMLENKDQGMSRAAAQDRQEKEKFTPQDGPSKEAAGKGVKAQEGKARQQQAEAIRAMDATKLDVTDVSSESISKEKIRTSSGKAARRIVRADAVDKKEFERRAQVAKQLLEIEQADEKKRRSSLDPAVGKGMDQAELIHRNQQAVKQILKSVAYDGVAVDGELQSAVSAEDPTTTILKQAATEEKRRLEEQRTAIRKEFEAGTEQLYLEGVGFFKKKLYQDARQDFEQVNGLIQGYKDTDKYLKKIDRILPSKESSSN